MADQGGRGPRSAPARVVEGPLEGIRVGVLHDEDVPVAVTNMAGDQAVYRFSIEGGEPTLRPAPAGPRSQDEIILAEVRDHFRAESAAWTLTCQKGAHGFVVSANHPASFGVTRETGTFDPQLAIERAMTMLQGREVAVADAAPDLAHHTLVVGLRSLIEAYGWPADQVRGLTSLLCEADALTVDEAAWLNDYVPFGA